MGATRDGPKAVYEIKVEGELDLGWQAWFSGLDVAIHYEGDRAPVTTLAGPVADQAALRGILGKLWDLNLTVVSVQRRHGAAEETKLEEGNV